MIRRLLLFLTIAIAMVPATAQQTVSGHLFSGTSSAVTNAFVRFRLDNYLTNVPKVNGTGFLVQLQFDVQANSTTGAFSTLIWDNDHISPGSAPPATTPSTQWIVEYWWNGQMQSTAAYTLTGCPSTCGSGGPYNLDTLTPNSTTPVTAAGTGDNTYLRLDNGNSGSLSNTNFSFPLLNGAYNAAVWGWQNALNAAAAAGGGLIKVGPGAFTISSSLTSPTANATYTIQGAGPNTVITKTVTGGPAFQFSGSLTAVSSTLTVNAAAGDRTLTLTSTTGFVAGRWIQVTDSSLGNAGWDGLPLQWEMVQVQSVTSGTVLQLKTALRRAYSTSQSAAATMLNVITVKVRNLKFISTGTTGAAIQCTYCVDSEFENIDGVGGNGGAGTQSSFILLARSYNSHIHGGSMGYYDGQLVTGGGGEPVIVMAASEDTTIDHSHFFGITELPIDQSSMGSVVADSDFHGCADSCVNTHGKFVYDTTFARLKMWPGTYQVTDQNNCVGVGISDVLVNIDAIECYDYGLSGVSIPGTISTGSISRVNVTNSTFANPVYNLGASNGSAIRASYVQNFTAKGNHIFDMAQGQAGISVDHSDVVDVQGNDGTQSRVVTGDAFVVITDTTGVTLAGNRAKGWHASAYRVIASSLGSSTLTLGTNYTDLTPSTPYNIDTNATVVRAANLNDSAGMVSANATFTNATITNLTISGSGHIVGTSGFNLYLDPVSADLGICRNSGNNFKVFQAGTSTVNLSVGCDGVGNLLARGSSTWGGGVAIASSSNVPLFYEAGVLTSSEKVYTNTQALTAGAATHTLANSFTFTSSATFGCTCTDQTAVAACKAVPASATTVTVGGTGTDTIYLRCSGH